MSWIANYSAYDDDTLAALSNIGLVRRAAKEVAAGKFAFERCSAEGGVIITEGQTVELDARGPQQARCNCPAPGICKHILGAVLWLRTQQDEAKTDTNPVAPPSVLQEVLALHWPALFKLAGIAAVRRAANTPLDLITCREQEAVLIIDLPALDLSCRYVAGAGFNGMVSEVAKSGSAESKAIHLMALAAVWQLHKQPVPWPDGVQVQTPTETSLGETETHFLTAVQSTLQELLRGGLSHVSAASSGRLLALNMSARGEGLPRLAAMLRNLGGMAQALERRDHRVEERDTLALIARINALCEALQDANGDTLTALRGRLRRTFAQASDNAVLTLLPVGAHWWQTLGGARGLTLSLWDATQKKLLQTTLARPDATDLGFHRESAWDTLALWPGAGSVASICAAALQIEHSRMSEDGRNMALGGLSRATKLAAWQANDDRLNEMGYANWDKVAAQLRAAAGLAGEPLTALLLRPSASQAPILDEAQQRVNWPVQDSAGDWLTLAIPCGPGYEKRIENLDRLTARRAPVCAVLVTVERSGAQVLLNPAAVMVGSGQDALQLVCLDYAKEASKTTTLTDRILRMFQARKDAAAPAVTALSLITRLLAPVNTVLETQAATGRVQLTEQQTLSLEAAIPAIHSVGLQTLARALQAHIDAPSMLHLMRLSYLCEILTELDGSG